MKNTRQLLVIVSIAAGLTLGGNSAHAQQVITDEISKPNTYSNNEYSTTTAKLNYKGDIVKHIQCTLNLHFGAGLAEDGIYGKLTEDAVKNIQKKLGVNADGIFGPKTAKALLNYIGNNSVDDQDGFSPVPIKIQEDFASLGYNINVNGNLSSSDTISAIKDFQTKNGLTVTGKVDIKMLNKLSEKVNNRANETLSFKSDTNYYIVANSSDHICRIYQKEKEAWREIKCFNILSGKINKGTYRTGLQGKYLSFNKIAMKDFTQISGVNVFYSAEKDSGCGLRVPDECAQLISKIPIKTTVKVF